MSTTLRRAQLKILKSTGFKYFKAKSNFKIPYLVCLGDYLSENPFFKPETNSEEIIACVAWCMNKNNPVIFDIGAHCGYFSTHFAGLLKKDNPAIYAFEPVAETYFDLLLTIKKLQLENNVFPMQAAISNAEDVVAMNHSRWSSMLSQVVTDHKRRSITNENKNFSLATTVDKITNTLNVFPDLIKLDVEGYESYVLQGAGAALQQTNKPAICIEWNAGTLKQCASSEHELASLLTGYDLYYLNDYEFGKKKFLEKINDATAITWVCNLFAVPKGSVQIDQWLRNIKTLQQQYNISIA
ncbi:MAG: FkbM family methyltransferase [Ferruginibacter sp.]